MMSGHLLAISVGPVQDFIAAARRTRDLWFGSFVLSEVSKAAAKAIAQEVGVERLIFPAPNKEEDLNQAKTEDADTLNVANVILTEVPAGHVPRELAELAKQAAQARWHEFAEDARRLAESVVRDEIWKDQVFDVIEFYAAWNEWPAKTDYMPARRHLTQLLAGRKACRDFKTAKGCGGVPKSSLDGAHESVLERGAHGSATLRLSDGEQLDVVGLTKRLAGGRRHYPSVARIAADPWLCRLDDSPEHVAQFNELKDECKRLADMGVLSRVSGKPFEVFPYEGTAVFASRHRNMAKEAGQDVGKLSRLSEVAKTLTRSPQNGGLGEPFPYLAILVADGDRMGACISRIDSVNDHRRFSRDLASFATAARKTVEDHNGICVYTGGDDVLAFVPLDTSLDCARALHDEFGDTMKEWTTLDNQQPTLSVGLAIGHFMESLEDLLNFGRNAEHSAKKPTPGFSHDHDCYGDRDGFAIHVYARGGEALEVRERWSSDAMSIDQRLKVWTTLFAEKRIPGKLPYELRQLADGYANWETADLRLAIECDLRLVLKRKQTRLSRQSRQWVHSRFKKTNDAMALQRLAAEMLVARWLSEVSSSQTEVQVITEAIQ